MSLLTIVAVLTSLYLGATAHLPVSSSCACSAEIQTLYRAISRLSTEVHQLHSPGATPSHPAISCVEIKEQNSISPSGYYWIRAGNGSAVRMYCDMDRTCRGVTGGWMQVANIDMSSGSSCPGGLRQITSPKRLCGSNSNGGGCSSAVFSVNGIEYNYVCGRVLGYQDRTPDGFKYDPLYPFLSLDSNYVDGVSITHGRNPRKHIWTLAAAADVEVTHTCPCMNSAAAQYVRVPSFVGSDYFCDTSAYRHYPYQFLSNNPLWDGQQCVSGNGCCTFNGPPWFLKSLGSPTSDDIEMRLCRGDLPDNEGMPIEIVELFVR